MTGWLVQLLPLPYPDAVVAVGAALLGIVAGLVGCLAVLRQRTLVGDALSHAALPGVALAFLLTGSKSGAALLLGAAAAGLVGALLVVGLERAPRMGPDAATGVVLSGSFSLGIVLLTVIAQGPSADQAGLERYLFGQAAGLLQRDVDQMAVLVLATAVVVALLYRPLQATLFDRAWAASAGLYVRAMEVLLTMLLVVAVVVGLRTVGAILMVAMLAMPAIAARQLARSLATMLLLAAGIGAVIGVAGALASARADTPTGPTVVMVGAVVVLVALMMAPRRGILWTALKLRRERHLLLREHLLGALDAAGAEGTDEAALARVVSPPSARTLRQVLGQLRREGLAQLQAAAPSSRGAGWVVTEAGRAAAADARSNRELWSLWQSHGWHLAGQLGADEPDPWGVETSLGHGAVSVLRRAAAESRR